MVKLNLGLRIIVKFEGLQKRVFFNTVKILHDGKQINAGIAYSFPRRDLPNAYKKMKEYGDFCNEELQKLS